MIVAAWLQSSANPGASPSFGRLSGRPSAYRAWTLYRFRTEAKCPFRVKNGSRGLAAGCLLLPGERTSSDRPGMSEKCQKRKWPGLAACPRYFRKRRLGPGRPGYLCAKRENSAVFEGKHVVDAGGGLPKSSPKCRVRESRRTCAGDDRQYPRSYGITSRASRLCALATIAVILDHPVSHSEAEKALVEEKP
jgi:hypothetical protein